MRNRDVDPRRIRDVILRRFRVGGFLRDGIWAFLRLLLLGLLMW
jgi:hypothetical protein